MIHDDDKVSCNLNAQQVDSIRGSLPVDEEIQDLAVFLKVFGDPTRIRILFLLTKGEFCVHDISYMVDMQQTAVSHQLKILRQARLVKYRKDGKNVFYALNDRHIGDILAIGLEHINE